MPILEAVRRGLSVGVGGAAAQFAFSDSGSFAYIPRGETTANANTLALVDRAGRRTDLNIPWDLYSAPRISPDGEQLAVQVGSEEDRAIFVADLKGVQPIRKLTFEGRSEKPLWTRDRDRQRVVFTSDREGDSSLFWQWVDGGPAERFAKIEGEVRPQAESWTPEGNVLLFSNRTGAGTVGGGLYIVSPGVNQQSKRIIDPPAGNSSLSPDGRWLAHTWFESGKSEVYVQPFPLTGEKHLITRDGGSSPLWSPDGRQLFFLGPATATEQLVAVDVRTDRAFVAEKITPLPIQGIVTTGPRSYDITPDGKHFLVTVPTSPTEARPAPRDQINITLNWFEELRRLAGSVTASPDEVGFQTYSLPPCVLRRERVIGHHVDHRRPDRRLRDSEPARGRWKGRGLSRVIRGTIAKWPSRFSPPSSPGIQAAHDIRPDLRRARGSSGSGRRRRSYRR